MTQTTKQASHKIQLLPFGISLVGLYFGATYVLLRDECRIIDEYFCLIIAGLLETGKLETPYRMDVAKFGCSTEIWTEGCVSAGGVTGDGFTSMILGK